TGVNGTVGDGINDMGQIVRKFFNSGQHGFLLSGGAFTTIDPPSADLRSDAFGINDLGQIVGQFNNFNPGTGQHGFLLSGGVFTTIDDPSATGGTAAFGTNDAGQIVGQFNAGGGLHGFLL